MSGESDCIKTSFQKDFCSSFIRILHTHLLSILLFKENMWSHEMASACWCKCFYMWLMWLLSLVGQNKIVLHLSVPLVCISACFSYLVRLLKQQYELHAYRRQSSTMGAMQAAVAQKHSQERLVTLQPVSPAPLAVVRSPGLETNITFIKKIKQHPDKDVNVTLKGSV